MSLGRRRTLALLRALAGKRVLVAGDVMLDAFIWGRVARISPEAPVPVVEVDRESFRVGGAGNVAANVRALGGEAVLAAVVGRDAAATTLRQGLRSAGIEDALAVDLGDRPTTVKTRIIAHHQQVVRADRECRDRIPRALEDALLLQVRSALRAVDAVVVSDYRKGVVTARLMKVLLATARRRGIPVLVDPKVRHFGLYRGAELVTPNLLEAEQAIGASIRSPGELDSAGAALLRALRCRALLVTRGEEGMSLFQAGRKPVHIRAAAREVYDVTGAGDTVIATLALALAARAPLVAAAELANLAAGVVVGKLGTATATPQELLAALGA